MKRTKLRSWSWNKRSVREPSLRRLLVTLGEHYPLLEGGSGRKLSARLSEGELRVEQGYDGAIIEGATVAAVARGLGSLLSGIEGDLREASPFTTAGLMLDCSRNAVMKVDYLKEWLRRAALFGYNQMMLYTKDTYELPDEECFGYLRGRYTAAELKELDAYAARLGIEMVGCIQALGHLEPVLRWGRYAHIKDTSAELLTTEERSYELIEKMLDFFSKAYRSRRIHLGMDETHGLGRGRYMDLHGYRRPFDIYIDHLNRVVGESAKRGLRPMIWSDMFFRMGSKNMDYYDRSAVTPPDIIAKIPAGVDLVYWDYYHEDADFYREWIRRHKSFGKKPIMASGIWTWPVFWCNHSRTTRTAMPCIEACAEESVEEIFFTMWGDDGGYCDSSSAQADACHLAEKLFNIGREPDPATIRKKFSAICGGDYDAHMTASELNVFDAPSISAPALLWDDPLLGIYRKDKTAEHGPSFWRKMANHYARIEFNLNGIPHGQAGDIRVARELAGLLSNKILAIMAAESKLKPKQAAKQALKMADSVENFERKYRKLWYARNKTFGYEVMQIRFAAQSARWRELARRLEEIHEQPDKRIPELEEKVAKRAGGGLFFKDQATASVYL